MQYRISKPLAETQFSVDGPPKKKKKKKFKPKGVNKPHSRRKMKKICVGGRCGA